MPEKKCSVCSKKFSLSKNPSGFVFRDEFFVCETCSNKHSDEEICNKIKTVMSDENGMPIALWLIHEQNKDKEMMTVKR